MSEELLKEIIQQNEVIISLLGRMAYNEETIKGLIVKNKKEELKNKYIEGYNSCDGKKNQSEIAEIIGISQPTFSLIVTDWVNLGIVYETHKGKTKSYKNLFPIRIDVDKL